MEIEIGVLLLVALYNRPGPYSTGDRRSLVVLWVVHGGLLFLSPLYSLYTLPPGTEYSAWQSQPELVDMKVMAGILGDGMHAMARKLLCSGNPERMSQGAGEIPGVTLRK